MPDAAAASSASADAGGAASAARGPSRVSFEVNPGKIQLRLSVEGTASQVLDSEVRDFTVPDLTSAQVVIGTPEVFRARVLKEFQQLKADPNAVPVPAREFSRTERVLLRVAAYAPGTATATVKARLLSRAGQAMSDLAGHAARDARRLVSDRSAAQRTRAGRVRGRDHRGRRGRRGSPGAGRVPRHLVGPGP